MHLSPEQAQQRQSLFALQERLTRDHAVLEYTLTTQNSELVRIDARQIELKTTVENLRLASTFLQSMIDQVSTRSIQKIEDLVNGALVTIFHDYDLKFRIISEVKRNTNTYRVALFQNGHEGTINAYGGGVIAVVAFVLKILFNRLTNRYPLLAFDESLSFLSEKYIPHASRFIREITRSKELGEPTILMVTHQPAFARAADHIYEATLAGPKTVSFKLKSVTQSDVDE